tara:strand:+ start:30 stop:518 length:489 start_codon:yes stop_codon:yes gene_type:complete
LEKIKAEKPNKKSLKSSSLSRIGNLIREARMKRNESIEELAAELKISVQQFTAIEEGQEELLPEKVFVKAMVKRISERLKIDTDSILSEFNIHKNENNINEIIEEVKKEKAINKQSNQDIPYFFIIAVLTSGMIGLFASSLVLNIFSSSDDTSVKEELIKRN